MSKSYILPANAMLLLVGVADLLSTLYWLKTGQVIEVNPVMAAVLHGGIGLFIGVKLATLGAFVGVMEWYRRRRNPAFAHLVGNATLIGYIGIYTVSFCCVNYSTLL
ncbi:MAG: DUF5658 family protein [Armatimonadota bacterium]